jgi:hypothetical protein
MSETTIPLPLLPRELRELTDRAPSYRALYLAALDGRIPATIGRNGRWSVDRHDLPRIAEIMTGGPVKKSPLDGGRKPAPALAA